MKVNYNSYNKKEDDDYGYEAPNMGAAIAKNDSYNIKYGNQDIDPNTDYMAKKLDAERAGDYNGAAYWERMRNAKIAAGFGGKYQPTYDFNYNPKYDDKITELRDNLENYKSFSYDPMKDEAYKSLTNVYSKNAEKAASNALAKAAAANGGRLSSNAMIATDLAYQDKMSELEAEIPQLRQAAYNMYLNEKNDVRNLMNDYINAESENYNKWADNYNRMYQNTRDMIGDKQWKAQLDYTKERDSVLDNRWQTEFDEGIRQYNEGMEYQRSRDAVDDAWRQKEFDENVRQWENEYEYKTDGRKASSGSGRSGGSGSSSGSGSGTGDSSSGQTVESVYKQLTAKNRSVEGMIAQLDQMIASGALGNMSEADIAKLYNMLN